MKEIRIQLLDQMAVDAFESIAGANYQEIINGEPNPQSREEFAKTYFQNYLQNVMSNLMVSLVMQDSRKKTLELAKSSIAVTVD